MDIEQQLGAVFCGTWPDEEDETPVKRVVKKVKKIAKKVAAALKSSKKK